MRLRLAIGIAFATGFVSLSYEILWYRVFAFATQGSAAIFGLLLGFFLLGIALGTARVRRLAHGAEHTVYVARLAWLVVVANVAAALVVPGLAWFAVVFDVRAAFALVLVGAGLMGATLPVLSHVAIEPDAKAGFRMSLVYIGNIAGSALGSITTGYVLTDILPTEQIALVLAGAGLSAAVAATFLADAAKARRRVAGLATTAFVALVLAKGALYGHLWERLLFKTQVALHEPLDMVIENRHGVAVVTAEHLVYGGGAYDGALNVSLDVDFNHVWRAYAVGAMRSKLPEAARERDVFMIGLSSGSWAEIVASLPTTRSLTIVEINPGYLDVVRRYDVVRPLLDDPKVTIEFDDARRWLRRHPERKFDVIVANAIIHWRASSTNLLSTEFLELARAHLRPGGIHYFNATASEDAYRTAIAAFPYGMRVMNFYAASDAPFEFDAEEWRRILDDVRVGGQPAVIDPSRRAALLDVARSIDEPVDPEGKDPLLERRDGFAARLGPGPVITDDNMLTETRQPWRLRTEE